MVIGKVCFLEYGSALELVGSHLVVTGFYGYAQTVAADFEVEHECFHARGDGAEVVVFELLVLGAFMSHEGTACEHEVGACAVERLVHEEVLLLPSEIGDAVFHLGVEVACHGGGGLVDCVERLQQRSLVVEGFAGV